jgi:hypothetical protein
MNPLQAGDASRLSRGGLSYRVTGGVERLWVATSLRGEIIQRVMLGIPLAGASPVGKVYLGSFDSPEGISELRGVSLSGQSGAVFALTGDRRVHELSDFGVSEDDAAAPRIEDVAPAGPGGGGLTVSSTAAGPLSGGTLVAIDGLNLGSDRKDLSVFFGEASAEIVRLEKAGARERIVVRSPPSPVEGPVAIFVFRTRGLDFIPRGFIYVDCDEPLGEKNDCNANGLADSCDLKAGLSLDLDQDGVPDECVAFDRRDPNQDGDGDLSDALYVMGFLFLGTPKEIPCPKSADTNDDGALDLSDPVYQLTHLFLGGPPPHAPFRACGFDLTADSLECRAFARCGR